jgi:hypothetical protein
VPNTLALDVAGLSWRTCRWVLCALCGAAGLLWIAEVPVRSSAPPAADDATSQALSDAQQLFYNARFEEAARRTRALIQEEPQNLLAYEVHSSVLHFQLKRALRDAKDKKAALAACEPCRTVLAECLDAIGRGQVLARTRLQADASDTDARFLLGKIDLTYVWLQLSTLDRKTGWDQYWEARRALDALLMDEPAHIRARVARAWIDYIVATRLPWGTRWVLGGGNKGRALGAMREAAGTEADLFTRAEAVFGLWEMEAREGNRDAAVVAARQLLTWFPENKDLRDFVAAPAGRQPQ